MGQLVDHGAAQEAAHSRDPGIILLSPNGPIFLGAWNHGAKLEDPEHLAAPAHSFLRIEYGSWRIDVDGQGQDGEKEGKDDKSDTADEDVHRPLEEGPETPDGGMIQGQNEGPVVANVLHRHPTGDLLIEKGHEADLHPLLVAVHDCSDKFAVYGVGDGKDNLGDIFLFYERKQIPPSPDDRYSFDDLPLLARVVVNVTNQLVL